MEKGMGLIVVGNVQKRFWNRYLHETESNNPFILTFLNFSKTVNQLKI
jgi:hypothetical protein